jgi:DNA (cytosine-5)-methyltransferase 1
VTLDCFILAECSKVRQGSLYSRKKPSASRLTAGHVLNESPVTKRVITTSSVKVKQLTTVELFCGIGGFRVAADGLGIKTVWANDVNSLACSVYRDRFEGSVLCEGDINSLKHLIPEHDVLTGGFPCQPFSAAGKKEGVRDPRGTLFQTIVDVVKEKKPKFFVLENVKRLLSMEHGIHFAVVLSALSNCGYSIEWRVLNAKDFGLAQNRERVIILGTRLESEDQGIALRLSDFAELPIGISTLLSDVSSWNQFHRHNAKFPSWGVGMRGRYLAIEPKYFSSQARNSSLLEILDAEVPDEYDYTQQTLERLHMNEAVDRFVNGVEIISNQAGGARMGYTIFGIRGIAPTLTASTSRHYERYQIGRTYRRLTPNEYARLQGFPDNHCGVARNYDQYALYGNAVPPPLVEWVLGRLLVTPKSQKKVDREQKELFGV